MLPKLIAIVGPTASGKTGLSLEIAKRIGGEVISVDSRQVYQQMDIGTAKVVGEKSVPNEVQQDRSLRQQYGGIQALFADKSLLVEGIPHWGMDLVRPDEEYSVAEFKSYAEQKIEEIVARGQVPILVGGTGLWISAIIDNYDLTQTPGDPALRAQLDALPLGELFAHYKQLDPVGAELIDRENKRRVVRALEVTKLTGKPFSDQQRKGTPKYEVLQIGLEVERDVLAQRINERVEEMIARGLVSEVRALKEEYGCEIDAMTGIGYRQICAFLSGEVSLASAIEEVKKATRQYAKRQMTWFKRDPRIVWVTSLKQALDQVEKFLSHCEPES